MSHAKTTDLVSTLEMLTSVPVLQHSPDQIVKVNIGMYIFISLTKMEQVDASNV